ncbi:MAG: Calx-beta domain-containing protein [Verrucomicrobiota bacterium]
MQPTLISSVTRRFVRFNLHSIFALALVLPACASSLKAGDSPVVAQGSSSPNVFGFASDVYYVDEDATNAVISVEFTPGDRGWSGSVNYNTENGTALDVDDYAATNGTLSFSGPGTPVPAINIPIVKDSLREGNETVEIYLSNPNAIITRSHATLIIVDKNQNPPLKIARAAGGSISLSWPSAYGDYVLEKSDSPSSTAWSPVTASRGISNGSCNVSESCNGLPVFYRLKKTSTP